MRADNAEMTVARRTQVLTMRAAGLTLRQIAAEVGLSVQGVNSICHDDIERKSQQAEATERIASGDPHKILFRDLGLSVRTTNVVTFTLGNDVTVADVILSDIKWMRQPNFGKTSLKELNEALDKFRAQLENG